jgi:hypothetical protein
MIKESLFAAEERETKLNQLGDVLQILEKHVDFAALAAAIDSVHMPGSMNNMLKHCHHLIWGK